MEVDAAQRVGRNAHRAPGREIRGAKDGVNSRRPGDSKLECASQHQWPDQLDDQRISENGDALISQSGDVSGQIRGGQRFGQNEGRERIAVGKPSDQLRHVGRQREVGQLIADEKSVDQIGQARRQVEAGELIPANVERTQTTQVRRQHEIGQLILGKEQRGQIGQARRAR